MKRSFLSLALILLFLVGCDALPTLSDPQAVPIPDQTGSRSPEEAVTTFLEAWNQQNLDIMYGLISPRSAEYYPFEEFTAEYEAVSNELNFEQITFNVHDTKLQGQSAAVSYDVQIDSPIFGTITDEDRTMRLLQEPSGWQIAWTPMDILDGMAANVRLQTQRRFPPRGNIYDRNGLPVVDQNGSITLISVRKLDMDDSDQCARLLARVMTRPYLRIANLFTSYTANTVFFVGELNTDVYNANQEEIGEVCGTFVDVPGFNKIDQITSRTYYGHAAMAPITGYIGFVPNEQLGEYQSRGYRSTDIVGLAGVELAFQGQLAGQPEQFLRLIEPNGTAVRELGGAVGSDPAPVTLTIDRELQQAMSDAFIDAFIYASNNWATVAGRGAAGVAIDVNTGGVLAMYSYPSYNPRMFFPDGNYSAEDVQFATTDPQAPLSNKAITEQYAPGSTFKIVTLLAAADTSIWTRDQIFDCTLTWSGARFGDGLAVREDWRVALEFPPAGPINMMQALATSCNPYFWEVGGLLYQQNPSTVANYARELGFGSVYGLEDLGLRREAAGVIPVPNSSTEALNNAIGQGDTQVSVLQMASMVAAVANNGTLYEPYVVQRVGGLDGVALLQEFEPEVVRQLNFNDGVLATTREGMCMTTTDEVLGTSQGVFGNAPYSSCGKTGTAQAGSAESGIAPHSWYVAFAPADNPQIAMAVVVPNSREGSEVATPITRRVLDAYFDAPVEPFPEWWEFDYVPLQPPAGTSQ